MEYIDLLVGGDLDFELKNVTCLRNHKWGVYDNTSWFGFHEKLLVGLCPWQLSPRLISGHFIWEILHFFYILFLYNVWIMILFILYCG